MYEESVSKYRETQEVWNDAFAGRTLTIATLFWSPLFRSHSFHLTKKRFLCQTTSSQNVFEVREYFPCTKISKNEYMILYIFSVK